MRSDSPLAVFTEAMDAIAQKAASQNCRIWIDAEQQVLQRTIDLWTIDLMRKYNVNGQTLIYNTLQSYLKASRQNLEHWINLAEKEGWTLCIQARPRRIH